MIILLEYVKFMKEKHLTLWRSYSETGLWLGTNNYAGDKTRDAAARKDTMATLNHHVD